MDKSQDQVFHNLKSKSTMPVAPKTIFLFLGVIVAGIVVGYLLSQIGASHPSSNTSTTTSTITKGTIYGSNDTATFKDTAEGTLQNGGIDGEGQFHLVRPGGDSQNVYMTSSLVDLSQFVGKKIKVWGQTQAAQHAGWLMDVGRVEVE